MTPEEMKTSLELSWMEIEKLHSKLKALISIQATAADHRADLALRVERNTLSLDKLTDQLLLLRQQRDEVYAAADERERLWIHEHRTAIDSFTKALIDLHSKIAATKATDEAEDDAEDKAADKLASAAAKTAEVATKAENALKELREATASQKTDPKDDEERHAGLWGVLPRIILIIVKAPRRFQVLAAILGFIIAFGVGAWTGFSLYDRMGRRLEDERAREQPRRRWEKPPGQPQLPPAER